MRIGIMSDSHGDRRAVEAAVKEAGDVELWLHAGDCCPDAAYLRLISDTRVCHVAGNCDWPDGTSKDERIVEAGGHRIFLTHGHIYGVRGSLDIISRAAEEKGADIAVFGHTHIAAQGKSESGVLILNPGSVSRPREAEGPSFMVMELADGLPPRVSLHRLAEGE